MSRPIAWGLIRTPKCDQEPDGQSAAALRVGLKSGFNGLVLVLVLVLVLEIPNVFEDEDEDEDEEEEWKE